MERSADADRLAAAARRSGPSDLRGWARAAIAALALVAVVELLAALGELNYALTLDGILSGTESLSDFRDARDQVRAFELASLVVLLLAAFTFVAWFFLAYRNLERAGIGDLRARPGWAVGAWLIPVVSFIVPKRIADDIWRGSEPGAGLAPESWRSRPVAPLVHAWWLLCLTAVLAALVATVANEFGSRDVLSTPQEFERERLAFVIYAAAEFAAAAAAVAAIRLVVAVTRRQRRAFGGDPGPPVGPPPPAERALVRPPTPSPWAPGPWPGSRGARPDK